MGASKDRRKLNYDRDVSVDDLVTFCDHSVKDFSREISLSRIYKTAKTRSGLCDNAWCRVMRISRKMDRNYASNKIMVPDHIIEQAKYTAKRIALISKRIGEWIDAERRNQ